MDNFFTPEEIKPEAKTEETENVFFTPREKETPFQEVIEGAPEAQDPDELTSRILGGEPEPELDDSNDFLDDSDGDPIEEFTEAGESAITEYEKLKGPDGSVKPASMGKLVAKTLDTVNSIICKWIAKTDSGKPFKAEKDELKDIADILTEGFKQMQSAGNWVNNPWAGAVIVFGMVYTPMYVNAFEIRDQIKKMKGENNALKQQIKDLEAQQFRTKLAESLKDNYHKLGANRARPSKNKAATAGGAKKVETRGRKKKPTDGKNQPTSDNLGRSA